MSIRNAVKNNPKIKKVIHRLLIPNNEARPRLWVKMFLNPFIHNYAKGSKIRWGARMDILPFNKFSIGAGSIIEDFCTVNNGVGDVLIGANTLIGMSNVIIGPVIIGNDVILAQNIVISGLNHDYQDISLPVRAQKVSTAVITVEDECWIGANSVITAGVTIGRHSVVAAGSIVTKSVDSYTVVAGNPAKVLKQYDQEQQKWIRVG